MGGKGVLTVLESSADILVCRIADIPVRRSVGYAESLYGAVKTGEVEVDCIIKFSPIQHCPIQLNDLSFYS